MIPDWQYEHDRKRLEQWRTAGYRFEITVDGYKVWLGTKFIGGASVLLPRQRPLHWRYRMPNLRENTHQAVLEVERFLNTP